MGGKDEELMEKMSREKFFRKVMEMPNGFLVATLRDACILTGTEFTQAEEVELLSILADPMEKSAYASMITNSMVEAGKIE